MSKSLIVIDSKLHLALKIHCAKRQLLMSKVVNALVKEYLDKQDKTGAENG